MPSDLTALRFILPLTCGAVVALLVACSNGGGGSEDFPIPDLVVDCDIQFANPEGGATDCGTGSSIATPTITARIKDDDADCDGSEDGTLALGVAAADECFLPPANDCTGTVTAWTSPDGGEPLRELEEGKYLADVWMDTSFGTNGTLDVGEPHSCTEFELDDDLETVTADFWMDFT